LNRKLAPAEPAVQSGVLEEISQTGITKVDILFVVDNSNSMKQEQEVLTDQIRLMAQELISPSDRGEATPPAVRDLHIGIVSTDLGVQGYPVDTCTAAGVNGDDGLLQNTSELPGCQSEYSAADCGGGTCPWLVHSDQHPDNNENDSPIWDDFRCVATLGTGGCGFEQQLEASRRALDPLGNAASDGPNAGFLRSDSLLAIIYVTDEDDCSTNNPDLFDPSRTDLGPLNLRCINHPEQLVDVQEYYDFFVNELRGGDADLVVVGAIVGIPEDDDLWRVGDSVDDLEALQVEDPNNPGQLMPSCSSTLGIAFPPVRIVNLAYLFGTNAVLQSICQNDWSAALTAITRKIQDKIKGVCTGRSLASTSSDVCRVIETLRGDNECPHLVNPSISPEQRSPSEWHRDLGVIQERNAAGDVVSRRICEILPADYDGNGCPDGAASCGGASPDYSGSLNGWFYDNRDPSCDFGQVKFTHSDITADQSDVRFECLTALCPERRQCGRDNYDTPSCVADVTSCGAGEVMVRHNSRAVCGYQTVENDQGVLVDRDCSCVTCVSTIGSLCPYIQAEQPPVADLPLVEVGGCCAVGFHCSAEKECVPDRSTRCYL
jgi:hypothetical protein